ncbi:translation initiation factor eIF 4e-like domain-containing protein [Ochromonadaceae sp. CCMP2298]|nr:translation initiation factor eIF 4e-like domain-containing protein [Ochromonadaceae sp. CCMP2298]|mmetsp:Transcript_32690/g.71940  ORF Transcript_32690/g.71940 Transcript_32690/m.71940 type:complete len:194 (+) Transcript_32690:186-767(+)|eukprot:CAMPEP_0173192632 /NCGR_PEP_ID=MMETSP1141-20130122/13525_1 /TAXON_ID=483371 /ORGANISM="non described non described, Strain CCMP2298" /LENGTH=193 /DNA_ID=CAMNT_0014116907 /DNA_START=168 /DNA_END=749 /DNA_ORIENTATION=+
MSQHNLQNTWVVWEGKEKGPASEGRDYSNLLREVCEFSTIEQFWNYWLHIPKPSAVFGDGRNKIYVEGRIIKAFLLFKKGIQPAWEDPANKNGAELVATKSFNSDVLDLFWENLVMGLIGETVDDGDEICGCRIVNQTRKEKPMYKIELWLRTSDEATCMKIKNRLAEALMEGESAKGGKVRPPDFELIKRTK